MTHNSTATLGLVAVVVWSLIFAAVLVAVLLRLARKYKERRNDRIILRNAAHIYRNEERIRQQDERIFEAAEEARRDFR